MDIAFLVTGAAGLIGSGVVKELVSRKCKVYAFDNFTIGSWKDESLQVEWIEGDLVSFDFESYFKGKNLHHIIHCAAHPGGKSLKEPNLNCEVNILGSMRLFKFASDVRAKILYLSSSAVYGEQPDKALEENDTLNPGTIYAVNKIACENYLKILEKGYGLKWNVLRLFATFGSGHKPSPYQGIVNIMLTQMASGREVVVKGSLKRVRGVLFGSDAARAIVETCLKPNLEGEILNISLEKPVTIMDIINEIAKNLGKDVSDFEIKEEPGTVGDPLYNYANVDKMKRLLEFTPAVSFEDGIKDFVEKRLR